MVVACKPKRSVGMVYRIRCADSVCKPPEGAVVKNRGAERLGKGACKGIR